MCATYRGIPANCRSTSSQHATELERSNAVHPSGLVASGSALAWSKQDAVEESAALQACIRGVCPQLDRDSMSA